MTFATVSKYPETQYSVVDTLAATYVAPHAKRVPQPIKPNSDKRRKYAFITADHDFMALAMETLGPWSSDTRKFINEVSEKLVRASGDKRAGAYFAQRVSLAVQRGNAACMRCTAKSDGELDGIYSLVPYLWMLPEPFVRESDSHLAGFFITDWSAFDHNPTVGFPPDAMLPECMKSFVITWLESHRELVVLVFCLPASFLFAVMLTLRALYRHLRRDPLGHDHAVRTIQTRVQQWSRLPAKSRRLLCTSRPNWLSLSTTFFQKHLHHQVPIPLYDILSVDESAMTVRVEPMVTIGDITAYLIPRGYSLAVTIELTDATLGGLALGTGMSTHSHKAGLYHETITSYEVVLGDGSLVKATEDNEYSDLYKALPWSHGSLGFLVALTLRIVKVKPYVKIRYIPVKGQKNYCNMLREFSGANKEKPEVFPDYIEGTIFSEDEAVVMVGDYSDYDPYIPVNHCAKWYKPWFYKHVESFLKDEEKTELIPLKDYFLRHNRAIFWVVEDMLSFGNHPLFRLFFGWLLPPKPAFLKWTTTPGVRAYTFTKQVFQDIVLPINELERQIEVATELFEKFPLLVYPCKIIDHGPMSGQLKRPSAKYLVPGTNYAMYNDLGVYGVPGKVKEKKKYNPVVAMRKMEEFTREVGGYSFLYADIFMTRSEFEVMFDLSLYEVVRGKYKADGAFPHLYDKVKPELDVFAVGEENAI